MALEVKAPLVAISAPKKGELGVAMNLTGTAKALQTGDGLPDPVRKMDPWRRQIAKFIVKLQ